MLSLFRDGPSTGLAFRLPPEIKTRVLYWKILVIQLNLLLSPDHVTNCLRRLTQPKRNWINYVIISKKWTYFILTRLNLKNT